MALRKQSLEIGEFYHLYNRGTDKRVIFLDNQDYHRFLFLMYICNTLKSIELRNIGENFDRGETIIDIGAYCLMPNHFHILVHEKEEGGISKYMLKLMTSYSMYFNKKYKRTGKLYEGVFKSTHAGSDRYLKYLYSYIHLNPAKLIDKNWKNNKNKNTINLLKYAFVYQYSSLKEYINSKFKIINPTSFPTYFKNPGDHKKELLEWLSFND
ncbi:MAG: Transposase [Candidatus Nomurabacteria bacterium GW2011_GWA1_37_20]|uniref:Transposase n=2 Tax=Parcubacteria group TaxID=1794811 RepID=A0A0G0KF88_9BACT|nr:MAG: Transposase [Parcubacteria group bacterium GW2011_GWC1_36_9]KKQ33741.1 MAG: Transposase [Candidatus Nomurabacteria bacterium GW2011_GWA1_37_20]KKQ47844.1 MAG: Transposase [Candidatus Yanofskybacteria bacterium GW2011_GWC2_37_9]